jgi:hypothetical protein
MHLWNLPHCILQIEAFWTDCPHFWLCAHQLHGKVSLLSLSMLTNANTQFDFWVQIQLTLFAWWNK